jgi:serine/threonine protein kinase
MASAVASSTADVDLDTVYAKMVQIVTSSKSQLKLASIGGAIGAMLATSPALKKAFTAIRDELRRAGAYRDLRALSSLDANDPIVVHEPPPAEAAVAFSLSPSPAEARPPAVAFSLSPSPADNHLKLLHKCLDIARQALLVPLQCVLKDRFGTSWLSKLKATSADYASPMTYTRIDEDLKKWDAAAVLLVVRVVANSKALTNAARKVHDHVRINVAHTTGHVRQSFESLEEFQRCVGLVRGMLATWNATFTAHAVSALFLSQLDQIAQAGAAFLKVAPVVDRQDLELDERDDQAIGQSPLANVFAGRYLGNDVAVKVMRRAAVRGSAEARQKFLAAFQKELTQMCWLNHPNIVRAFGGIATDEKMLIVMELMEGSLHDTLVKRTAPIKQRLLWATEVASALHFCHFVHCPRLLHLDLKSHNVLLLGGTAKLGDFGSARAVAQIDAELVTSTVRSTLQWMAPELKLDPHRPSAAADVYSFGLLLWELLENTGAVPPTGELAVPAQSPERVVNLMKSCTSHARENRPDMTAILQLLRDEHAQTATAFAFKFVRPSKRLLMLLSEEYGFINGKAYAGDRFIVDAVVVKRRGEAVAVQFRRASLPA